MLALNRFLHYVLTQQILSKILVRTIGHKLRKIHLVSMNELHRIVTMVESIGLRAFAIVQEVREKAKDALCFHQAFFIVLSSSNQIDYSQYLEFSLLLLIALGIAKE